MASAEKTESVASLRERLSGVRTAVLTEYRGLSVQQMSELRKSLKGARAEYKVVKNRLARIAVKDSPLDGLAAHLTGPTGLAFTREDPVSVAKALQAFARTHPALTIKVGLVEGRVLAPAEIRSLADLPSKEALRAQLLGAIEGPMSQLVSLLTAVQGQLVRVLEARGKQETQQGTGTEQGTEAAG